ncbi:MAG: hypothetical protein COA69_02165 [Robiginitomaculum sp.]|nr:MAG: hypothetical protein COA69_02165 [Robiginitomaculum sp.]
MSIETPQDVRRFANIQALRGFAALLVVVSHLFIIEQKYSPDHILGSWVELGRVGVDLFFVISGFIMVHVAHTSLRGGRATSAFLFARMTRIYPLYWLISLILVLIYLWRPDLVFSSLGAPPNIWKSFMLFPDTRAPLLAVGWTLIHEMGFYLVFALAIFLKPRWLLGFLVCWGGVLALGQKMDVGTHSPLLQILLSPLTYEFLAGTFAGYIYHRFKGIGGRTTLAIGLVLWGATLTMLISTGHGMIDSHWGRVIHFTLPAMLSVYGLASLKSDLPKCTQVLGDWSYALYLTHVLSLSLLGRIWHNFATQNSWDNWIILPVLTLASIAAAGMVHKWAEKPMLQLAKRARAKLFP